MKNNTKAVIFTVIVILIFGLMLLFYGKSDYAKYKMKTLIDFHQKNLGR